MTTARPRHPHCMIRISYHGDTTGSDQRNPTTTRCPQSVT